MWVRVPPPAPNGRALNFNGLRLFPLIKRVSGFQSSKDSLGHDRSISHENEKISHEFSHTARGCGLIEKSKQL